MFRYCQPLSQAENCCVLHASLSTDEQLAEERPDSDAEDAVEDLTSPDDEVEMEVDLCVNSIPKRVAIWWTGEAMWFSGRVAKSAWEDARQIHDTGTVIGEGDEGGGGAAVGVQIFFSRCADCHLAKLACRYAPRPLP